MMAKIRRNWSWQQDHPGVIALVVLILIIVFLLPECRGKPMAERETGDGAQPLESFSTTE